MHTVSLCLCVSKRIDIWTVLQNLRQASCCLCVWMTIWQLSPRLQEPVGTRLRWSAVSRQGGMDGEMTELTERERNRDCIRPHLTGIARCFWPEDLDYITEKRSDAVLYLCVLR